CSRFGAAKADRDIHIVPAEGVRSRITTTRDHRLSLVNLYCDLAYRTHVAGFVPASPAGIDAAGFRSEAGHGCATVNSALHRSRVAIIVESNAYICIVPARRILCRSLHRRRCVGWRLVDIYAADGGWIGSIARSVHTAAG